MRPSKLPKFTHVMVKYGVCRNFDFGRAGNMSRWVPNYGILVKPRLRPEPGRGLSFMKPGLSKAGPKPWLAGQAGPAHHYHHYWHRNMRENFAGASFNNHILL